MTKQELVDRVKTQLKMTWDLFYDSRGVIEVRALLKDAGKGPAWEGWGSVVLGYFDSFEAFAKCVMALEATRRAKGTYIMLNPVRRDLMARAHNRLIGARDGEGSADKDIVARRWLLIDCDPIRPGGISSTDEELQAAVARADELERALGARGWPAPVRGMSGNGAHLLYAVDLPNDTHSKGAFEGTLKALQLQFGETEKDTEIGACVLPNMTGIKIDMSNFNAARITKLYGTWARKGDHVDGRPHRVSTIDSVPEPLIPVSQELLLAEATIYLDYQRCIEEEKSQKRNQERRPQGERGDVIGAFNREYAITDMLRRYEYTQGRGSRWSRPGKVDSLGVLVDAQIGKSYHFSDNDPMRNGHRVDSFDLYCHHEHGGDVGEAVKAAAQLLNIVRPPLASQPRQANGQGPAMVGAQTKATTKPATIGPPSPATGKSAEAPEPTTAKALDPLIYRQEDGGILDAWVEHYGCDWIYATGAERWFFWHDHHWKMDEQLFVQKNVRELLDDINRRCSEIIKEAPDKIAKIVEQYKGVDWPESAEKQIQELQKGSTIAEGMRKATKRTNGRIASIEGMARSINAMPISVFDIDESLNLANGTLSLHSMEMRPHNPKDLFTYKLDYEYDPTAKCPLFEKFIAEVLVKEGTTETDYDLLALFQELLGYSLTTQTKREVMVWMFGDGGNGKSVAISVIEALLGPMAISVDLQAIGTPGNYELADIPGKRVIFSTEAERGGTMAEGYIKRIVTGDTMKARPIYGQQFPFKSTGKIWWAMNDRPTIKDTSDSIWRRMKLIPFLRKFDEGVADVNLPRKLQVELPGILNFALDGLARLTVNDRFTFSEAAEIAKAQYREESNPVARWVNTMVVRTSHPATLQSALYENFCQWMSRQNERAITSNQFGRDLSRLKIPKTKRSQGFMYNLALVNSQDFSA